MSRFSKLRKSVFALFVLATAFSLVLFATPKTTLAQAGMQISIPAIDVNAPIVDVHIRQFANGEVTWDVSHITQQVGYFVGTTPLAQDGNTVLGGHSELDNRSPGVFYRLHEIEVGDEITVSHGASQQRFVVTRVYVVPFTDINPVMPSAQDRLTLITCDRNSYNAGHYNDRLVVIARPA